MPTTRPRSARKPPAKRSPRRLSRDARREQLIDAAMPIVAEQGLSAFSLDEVARRADVTRNLLYHYFPRGRADIIVAVGDRAGHELTDGWVTDESIPLQERMASNFFRFLSHSEAPSDAWVVHRLGRASNEPEFLAVVDRYEDIVAEGISQNNFGTTEPPQLAWLAIKGFIAFTETVLDHARESDVPREEVMQMVAQTLAAALQSIKDLVDLPR